VNLKPSVLAFVIALTGLRTYSGARPVFTPDLQSAADTSWLARQPVICGEVHGRVLDARTGRPLPQADVTLDSATRGVSTDTLGMFRIPVTPFTPGVPMLMRPVSVRIRYIGMLELKFFLPEGLVYVVEATLAPMELHVDHISTMRIKKPGFCERAT
jgi:hypothetical protein